MTITVLELPPISQGDVESMDIAFDKWLKTGETLTGSPTAAEQTTSDLTLGTPTINGSTLEVLDETRAVSTVVSVPTQGQLNATGSYAVKITATTTESRTKNVLVKFYVDTTT